MKIDETNSLHHKEHFNIKFVKIGWQLRKLWLKMSIFDFKINKMAAILIKNVRQITCL